VEAAAAGQIAGLSGLSQIKLPRARQGAYIDEDPGVNTPSISQIVVAQVGDDEEDPIREQFEPKPEDQPLYSTPSNSPAPAEAYIPYPIEGRQPRNVQERDAMHEAMKLALRGAGREIMPGTKWGDPRFQAPGWQSTHMSSGLTRVTLTSIG
jgi:hypothetical protein